MSKKIIKTEKSPLPFGLYSQAVQAQGFLFVSGQLPIRPGDTDIVSNDPEEQLKQCFENMRNICEEAGRSLNDATKLTIYYTDFAAATVIDTVMQTFFEAPYPARTRIKVAGLSRNAMVEIDGIFICPN